MDMGLSNLMGLLYHVRNVQSNSNYNGTVDSVDAFPVNSLLIFIIAKFYTAVFILFVGNYAFSSCLVVTDDYASYR